MGWLRNYLRRRMQPIPMHHAYKMKHRLAFLYVFVAWNCGGLALYWIMQDSYPKTEQEKRQPARWYARILQQDDVTVINFDGFRVAEKYIIEGLPNLNAHLEEIQSQNIPNDQELMKDTALEL